MEIKKQGHRAAVILMIYRDSDFFKLNGETDPDFEKAFYEAISLGVEIYPIQFKMEKGKIYYTDKIKKIELP